MTWLVNAAGTGTIGGARSDQPGSQLARQGQRRLQRRRPRRHPLAERQRQRRDLADERGRHRPDRRRRVGTNPGPTWHVKGSGDFNGDGHADILWQNDNGSAVTWLMNAAGTGMIGGASSAPTRARPGTSRERRLQRRRPRRHPVAERRRQRRDLAGGRRRHRHDRGRPRRTNPGPSWHVKGSSDFNGDGHADILWQNDDGGVATWLMDAPAPA